MVVGDLVLRAAYPRHYPASAIFTDLCISANLDEDSFDLIRDDTKGQCTWRVKPPFLRYYQSVLS